MTHNYICCKAAASSGCVNYDSYKGGRGEV